ncbi:MAG: hypothetical protein AAB250_12005, partial [Bdellovibrionota bacterium]
TTKSAPLENGQIPADMVLPETPACAALPTNEKGNYGFDSRVLVGDVFVAKSSFASSESASTFTSATTITGKTQTSLVAKSDLSNFILSPMPGGPLPMTITYITTCTLVPDSYPDCKMEFQNLPPSTGGPSNSLECTFSYGSEPSTGMAETGTFTLKGGQTIQGLRVTETHPITIKCHRGTEPDQDFGKGTAQSVTITTRDLVDDGAVSCYSSRIAYGYSA